MKKGTDEATTNATIKDVANYAFEVGELAATASGDAASNYQLPSDKGATTIKIVPAPVTVTWKLGGADKTDSTYNGSKQPVTFTVKNGSSDITNKFELTTTGSTKAADVQNAGNYTFTVAAKSDTNAANYTLPTTNATQTFTIAKATCTLTASIPSAIKGVGGTGTVTLALGANDDKDSSAASCNLTVTANPTGIVTLPTAGTYATSYTVTGAGVGATDLTFTLAASDNYNDTTAKATVISQAKKPTMKIVPVFHGKTGGGYLTQFYPPVGPITYLGITQDRDGHFKFVVAEGVNEEGPIFTFGDTNMRMRFTCGAREVCNKWSEAGPTHHMAAAVGRHIDTILKVAKIFNVPVDIITR